MLRWLALISILVTSAWPQNVIPITRISIPTPLREFLELTEPQVIALNVIVVRFRDFQISKTSRRAQVQAEITEETARETMDPTALGLRYREVELINRDIAAEKTKNRAELLAALTPAQRAKLAALDQALKLQSTACTAVSYNLLDPPPLTLAIYDPLTSLGSFMLGPVVPSTCGSNALLGFPGLF